MKARYLLLPFFIVGCAETEVGSKSIDAPIFTAIDAPLGNIDAPGSDGPSGIDAGCTNVSQQLLVNPGFDQGQNPWIQSANFNVIRSSADSPAIPVGVQDGTHAVWLGGDYSVTQTLYQDLLIPANASALELRGYHWVATEEVGGVWDSAQLELQTTTGSLLESLASWTNEDETTAWTQFTAPIGGNYAGQTVRLKIQTSTDSSLNTNFFFDSFVFSATVCM